MNPVQTPLAILLAFSLAGAHAQAPERVTRAQVIAETLDAVRAGDIMAPGDSGMKLNEVYPVRYPKVAAAPAKTRAEVVAELQDAIRNGDVFAHGDSGLKENELFPQRYPGTPVAGKTREQVRAETIEAIRTGDILAAGETGLKLSEQFPGRYDKARTDADPSRRAVASTAPAGGDLLRD